MRHPLDDVLARRLPRGSLYAVGGRVRDEFRSRLDGIERPPKDLDYVVTGMPLEALLDALRGIGRVDVVGASFAVLKFRHPAGEADVALRAGSGRRGSGTRSSRSRPAPTSRSRTTWRAGTSG